MTSFVLDASIMAKLFFPEAKSIEAKEFIDSALKKRTPLYAPTLLYIEIASVAYKKVNQKEIKPKDARSVMETLTKFPIEFTPLNILSAAALEIALHTGCTPYDGAYIALAEATDSFVITADNKLVTLVSKTIFGKYVTLI